MATFGHGAFSRWGLCQGQQVLYWTSVYIAMDNGMPVRLEVRDVLEAGVEDLKGAIRWVAALIGLINGKRGEIWDGLLARKAL